MYLVFTLAVSKEVAPLIEEELYSIARSGWEYEERDLEVIFKFYFPLNLEKKDSDLLEHLHSLSQKYEVAKVELSLQPKEKWEEIWKYNFPPLKVGKRLLVLPPWEEGEEEEGRIKGHIHNPKGIGIPRDSSFTAGGSKVGVNKDVYLHDGKPKDGWTYEP